MSAMLPEIIDAPITEEPMITDKEEIFDGDKLSVDIQSDEEIIPEVNIKCDKNCE